MRKTTFQQGLTIVLLFMNIGYILYTIRTQGTFELFYNNIVVWLNVIYFGLELIPTDEI